MAYELGRDPDHDIATRTGELAMLIYSIGMLIYSRPLSFVLRNSVVGVIAGTLLPHLSRRDTRLLAHAGDEDEDTELTRLKLLVREWRAEAARKGKPLRLPFMPFFLRNIWTGALLLFTVITFSTFFITKVWQVRHQYSMII